MKTLIITCSPHKDGTSARLAESFKKGAAAAGHIIKEFDAGHKKISPCLACYGCIESGKCVIDDDMAELVPLIEEADAIIFTTPIYYYNVSAQLKLVIDRLFALGDSIHKNKSAALLMTMEDDTTESSEGPIASFKGFTGYMEWKNLGALAALNTEDIAALEKTDYEKQAYEMGLNLAL